MHKRSGQAHRQEIWFICGVGLLSACLAFNFLGQTEKADQWLLRAAYNLPTATLPVWLVITQFGSIVALGILFFGSWFF